MHFTEHSFDQNSSLKVSSINTNFGGVELLPSGVQ